MERRARSIVCAVLQLQHAGGRRRTHSHTSVRRAFTVLSANASESTRGLRATPLSLVEGYDGMLELLQGL